MKKALVIGASGQIGSCLVRALEQAGIEVCGTRFTRSSPLATTLDVQDPAAVKNLLSALRPETIFLGVIAPGGVDACEKHPSEARRLHVDGTRHILEAAHAIGARLVYYSTDYLFDGRDGPYSEDAPPSPLNIYGQVKLEAENIIREKSPDSLIIRTTAVYSWERTSRNMAMQVWETLQAGKTLQAANDQWMNPTLADYLAELSVRLSQMETHGTINIVGKDYISRFELAQLVARTMGLNVDRVVPVSTATLGQPARRPSKGGFKTEKLKNLIGTDPMDLDEAMKRFRRQWKADTHIAASTGAPSVQAVQLKEEISEKVRQYYHVAHKPKPFTPYKTRIQYSGRVFGEEELTNLVDSSLDFWLTLSSYGDRFEQKLKQFLGAHDVAMVNSGSAASLTAVMTLMSNQLEYPLRPGDEVITPAATFPTTLAPVVHSGLLPVFVDCELGTYNLDPKLLEQAVSPKTRAIIAPHTLGNPCDLDVLVDIAKRHHLYLVEDSCDALGATFDGKPVGTFGDLGTLSFYPAHHITTGEGGAVIINRPRLSRLVRSVRDWGRDCWCAPGETNSCGIRFGWKLGDMPKGYDHKYTYSNIGYNFKPTDMQAAVGVAQMDRLTEFIARRRENFKRLYEGLRPYQDRLILPRWNPRAEPSWFGFPITVQGGASRMELVQWLERANIETREVFAGNILRQPGYKNIRHRIHGTLEQTDRVMRDTFFIGVYPGLTDAMIDFMIERFQEFFKR